MNLRQIAVVLSLAAAVVAQEPAQGRSLADLNAAFMAKRLKVMREEGMSLERHRELMKEFAAELEGFLAKEAKGRDRFEARLMLTDAYLGIGDEAGAKKALTAFDTAGSPALLLVEAARLAGQLGLDEQRGQWIDAALAKDMPFEDRMRVGMHLMTALQEIDRGEKLFADALSAAADDEARAKVAWYQAAATREREDLPDGAYDDALAALATKYPDTHYGSIAADRAKAREFTVGGDPLPLQLADLDGKPVQLTDYAGKVLLLDFGAAWNEPYREIAPLLAKAYAEHHERGFDILTISLDDDCAQFHKLREEQKHAWRACCDGKGWETEAALRYHVEAIPNLLLLGRDGKIAAMNLFPADEAGRKVLAEEIEKALAKK